LRDILTHERDQLFNCTKKDVKENIKSIVRIKEGQERRSLNGKSEFYFRKCKLHSKVIIKSLMYAFMVYGITYIFFSKVVM
jgi:hypothetical protein